MIHLPVKELLICSSTVALPVEVVNTQHGGLSPEQSCKYRNLLNLNRTVVKSLQDSFLICISTACCQVKDNSPISLTVLACSSGWKQAVPSVCSTATVLSPCFYSKTGCKHLCFTKRAAVVSF